MKNKSFSITNRIVVIDKNNGFSRFLKNNYPNLDIKSVYKKNEPIEIDLNEDDILFIISLNEEEQIPTEYLDNVKWIFIVETINSTKIEVDNELFYINYDWIKSDIINYISKCFEKIAKEIASNKKANVII